MNIHAKYFGDISYDKDEIVHIENGLIGFESYTEYLPIPFQEDDDFMLSLQSLENEELSFVLMNPFKIYPGYSPALTDADRKSLDISSDKDISYYVISVIRDMPEDCTVNLKAPLVVNVKTQKARQIILDQPEYAFRHHLADFIGKEEG